MTWLAAILAMLATFRVSWMVTREEGPFGVFSAVRERLDPRQQTWLGRGINCPWCVSFWLALPLAALALWGGSLGTLVLLALSCSAVAGIVSAWLEYRH